MKKLNIVYLFFFFYLGVLGQNSEPAKVFITGGIFDQDSTLALPEAILRLKEKAYGVDEQGRFAITARVGDTLCFSHVGYVPVHLVVPDSLAGKDFLMGVFMTRDTVLLSEVLILPRFLIESKLSNTLLLNAKNNMNQALQAASMPVKSMDQEMNRRMMIEDFARKVEMKGLVDVKLGVGTQSLVAFKGLMQTRNQMNREKMIEIKEIDLLKKIFYIEKR